MKIGFIGLGIMGKPMVKNLLKAGYPVMVWNRSQAPIDEVVACGAVSASKEEIGTNADVVITMVPNSPQVKEVMLGAEGVAQYNNLIKSHDRWELVDIYADEGITGTSAKKRGDFQRMLEDCRKGKIDKILVKSISRFARNTKDCLEAVRELRTLGISIFFEEHNIDTRMVSSEMLTSVIAACAQAESESISQNMKWSIQKKMQNGTYVASNVPFGFRRINGNLVVEESEARYVRDAFRNYLAGKSTSDIAKEFTAQSAADPVLSSRKWSFQAIVEMLKNEKYIGDAMYQKTYMTDSLPRQCLRNRGERDRYYASDTHPGIIDRQSYDAVQLLLQKRSEKHVQHTVNTSPLGGRFICGKCGAGFRRKQNNGNAVFSCMSHV